MVNSVKNLFMERLGGAIMASIILHISVVAALVPEFTQFFTSTKQTFLRAGFQANVVFMHNENIQEPSVPDTAVYNKAEKKPVRQQNASVKKFHKTPAHRARNVYQDNGKALSQTINKILPVSHTKGENSQVQILSCNPPPHYPLAARRQKIQGTVLLRLFLTPSGQVDNIIPLMPRTHPLLEEAAIHAARKWRFGLGRPSVEIPVEFRLVE